MGSRLEDFVRRSMLYVMTSVASWSFTILFSFGTLCRMPSLVCGIGLSCCRSSVCVVDKTGQRRLTSQGDLGVNYFGVYHSLWRRGMSEIVPLENSHADIRIAVAK